jgi:hypothetical protein
VNPSFFPPSHPSFSPILPLFLHYHYLYWLPHRWRSRVKRNIALAVQEFEEFDSATPQNLVNDLSRAIAQVNVWCPKAISKYIEKVAQECRLFYQSMFPRYRTLHEHKKHLETKLKSCSLTSLRKPVPRVDTNTFEIDALPSSSQKDPFIVGCEDLLRRMGLEVEHVKNPDTTPLLIELKSPKGSTKLQAILDEIEDLRSVTIDRENASHYKGRYKKLFAKCSSQGAWQEALIAYETYALSGFELAIDIFHHMISSCRNSTPLQPDKAIAILHEIQRSAVEPTVRTFNLVIEICGLARQWRKAAVIFSMIGKSKLVPTSCTFVCLSQVICGV